MLARLLSCALVACAVVAAPQPVDARSLDIGFNDEPLASRGTDTDLSIALPRARQLGASTWRVQVVWRSVAPSAPPSATAAADPGWSGYRWDGIDRVVRAAAAAGLEPLLYVRLAPDWAEGPGRPADARRYPAGTWRPSPSALGTFATALARRYSGTYPDPTSPAARLPRVRLFQGWNEPNLYTDLNPQWTRTDGRWTPASPASYRRLLNAFYRSVKSVQSDATVLSAGTGPFGDLNDGDPRMPPVRFWRELLCVSEQLKARRCPTVYFDTLAHHPYPLGPPRRKARNADDVVIPDLRKITRLLPAALREGTLRPRRTKPTWVTEISWDTRPDPEGLSLAEQAQYMEGALYILWQQGVTRVVWWNLRDEAPIPSYAATYQSGVFLQGPTVAEDTPKPSATALRFPFTAFRNQGVARLWGKTPVDRSVTIQAQQGGRWVTAARLRAGSNRIFTGRLRVGPNTPLRAVAGPDTSLVWRTQ